MYWSTATLCRICVIMYLPEYNGSTKVALCSRFSTDNTSTILNTSIVTQYENWNRETEVKLSNILKRFKQENNVGSK